MTIHSQGLPSQQPAQQQPMQQQILAQLLGGNPTGPAAQGALQGTPTDQLIRAMGLGRGKNTVRNGVDVMSLLRDEIEGRTPDRVGPQPEQGPSLTSAEPENRGFFSFLTDPFRSLNRSLGSDQRRDINVGAP